MEIKEKIISRFDKSKFALINCGTAPDGEWEGIDIHIKDFIIQLNKCEYISTLYSCEGHHEKDVAYLYFSVNESGWDIFWQKIMPELATRFCMRHPEVPDALYQMEWVVSSTSNKYNAGINVSTKLENFAVEETGRVITTWEQKQETFWSVVKETFLKYYIPKEEIICPICKSNNVETREDFRRTSGPRVPGKLMSYGYFLQVHICKKCINIWDGKEIKK